jgi:hypothetical protein
MPPVDPPIGVQNRRLKNRFSSVVSNDSNALSIHPIRTLQRAAVRGDIREPFV